MCEAKSCFLHALTCYIYSLRPSDNYTTHLKAIQVASRVAQEVGVELGALVELNVGQNRCGVEEPGEYS